MRRKKGLVILIAFVAVAAVGFLIVTQTARRADDVLVLCGGSMRAVVERALADYSDRSEQAVMATYGGSGELCAQILETGRGDLFVCHDPFMPWAEQQGLIAEWDTVGYLDPVIIVPKGNPDDIRGLADLAREELRLGIGDQTYSTSGVIAKTMLNDLDYGDAIRRNIRLETKGHQQRCTDVVLGTLEVAIVWNAVAYLFRDEVEIMPIPGEHIDAVTSATYGESDLSNVKVTVGLTTTGGTNPAARRFYEYLTTEAAGLFPEFGFRAVEE
ncbi:MAG: substrate-binding domain-containing protein [Candidatus Brocadiia bacterium]